VSAWVQVANAILRYGWLARPYRVLR